MASSNARRNMESRQQQIAYHEAEVQKECEKWHRYRKEGTGDQWPDGVGLNLTRNHIIYHLMQIASIRADDNPFQLSIWDTPEREDPFRAVDRQAVMHDSRIPPEVSNRLMVTHRRVLYGGDDLIYET